MRAIIALFSVLFTIIFCPLMSEEVIKDENTFIDFRGIPSAVIGGAVNVITGHYFECETDMATTGMNPVAMTRYFSSGSKESGELSDFWDLNISGKLRIRKSTAHTYAKVKDRGVELRFKGFRGYTPIDINPLLLKAGVTNVCSPYASGRTNLKNRRVDIEEERGGLRYSMTSPGGERLNYEPYGSSSGKYRLKTIVLPNGCGTNYHYANGKVDKITAASQNGDPIGQLQIYRGEEKKGKRRITVTSDDGREVTYTVSKMPSKHRRGDAHRYCLSDVERTFAPAVKYFYKNPSEHKRDKLIRKEHPDNRYLEIEYVKGGDDEGKVKALYAPIGVDAAPILAYRIEYSKKKKNREASVFDALGNKKTFAWTKEHRLSRIDELATTGKVYRSETLTWGKEKTPDYTYLKSRAIKDARGDTLLSKDYTYDRDGNILEECLIGNLSGIAGGPEKFVKRYTYTKQNLVLTEDDGHQIVAYAYYPGTDLIRLKTISDHTGVRQRQYYQYDANASVQWEVTDDGQSSDINDLSGVSERHIKRVRSTAKGLPHVVEELYLDLTSQEEVLVKRTINTFSGHGLLEKEEVFDSMGNFTSSREWRHDSMGNVLEETDPAGRKTYYTYDLNGNRISRQTPNNDYYTVYFYDHENRLIKEEERHCNGSTFSKNYTYDYVGNKTSESDIYGNVVSYVYDEFGRQVERVLPHLPDAGGQLYRPSERLIYNELNHPTLKQDANGFLTKIDYNAYGKPTTIEHPDGSIERFIYNLDGTLQKKINNCGTQTRYEYDYLKRKVCEEIVSSDGRSLSVTQWKYNAFHLLSEIDPEGNVTTYSYDDAGRIVSETKGDAETRYFYDAQGRQKEKWEFCGEGKYRVTSVEYDVLDQVVEEQVQSGSGEVFIKKEYQYDIDGNRTHEIAFGASGTSTTITLYNARRQPIKTIAPDGAETTYLYQMGYRNSWGQSVPYDQVIDPNGNMTTTIWTTHGKIAQQDRQNIFGRVVQRTENTYDALGRLLKRLEAVIVSGDTQRVQTTGFEYDSMGREIAVFEAMGEPEQKTTLREYNAGGEVSKIVKPDGVIIQHIYDPLGRLAILASSDGTIHHTYSYDKNHNIVEAHDHISETSTMRGYDINSRLRSETLGHGLRLEYNYDPLGRLVKLTLPDASEISYEYDSGYLSEVRRGGKRHRYHYDTAGKVIRSELMLGLGEVNFQYDESLRPIAIQTNYWRQEITKYDPCGNILEAFQEDSLSRSESHYEYDEANQLVYEDGVASHQFQYDSIGNRVIADREPCEVNPLNQLLYHNGISYRYDRNGNLILRSDEKGAVHYRYDALDRLVAVETDSEKYVYLYDPFHRRIEKVRHLDEGGVWKEVLRERYCYQGEKEIGTVDPAGSFVQLRVMGLGCGGEIGAAVLMEFGGKPYIPIHDYRGNVALLLDPQGDTVEAYQYSAFGMESHAMGGTLNPWRYSSKRVDPETGWSYFGRRYYDPEVGRWTTPDPLWFVDGTNLYCYVRNRPTLYIDPSGLFLEALFDVVKRTLSSLFEFISSPDLQMSYQGNGAVVYANYEVGGQKAAPLQFDKKSHCFRYEGPVYGNVYFSTVNGINNSLVDSHSCAEILSQMNGGSAVWGVYNATHGLWDLWESFLNLLGARTRPVALLHEQWNDIFKNCGEDGIIIHVCHSQGAILTRNALKNYEPELRERIHVIAVAPAAYIDEGMCGSIIHYVSKGDIVPKIDFLGRWRNQHNIVYLDRHPDANFFDHSFNSPTFSQPLGDRIDAILHKHGKI